MKFKMESLDSKESPPCYKCNGEAAFSIDIDNPGATINAKGCLQCLIKIFKQLDKELNEESK